MKNKHGERIKTHRTWIYVCLVFLSLVLSFQVLLWLYWAKALEPRLRKGAGSQANVLAHSQGGRLADALTIGDAAQRLTNLNEAMDEIFLFTDPETNIPLFLGCSLEIDYDVVNAEPKSLDISLGKIPCNQCIISDVALYSPHSDELIGIARFYVSDSLYQRLSKDVKKTLFSQSHLGTVLLIIVCCIVLLFIREINASRQKAISASRAKSAFLANMSHELRTPLNSIIGFSELMSFDPEFLTKHKENLSIINRSGEYLLELINDILELSKIEADQNILTETSFDLHNSLNEVVEWIRPRIEKKNLQFVIEKAVDIPRFITTDERKLRQILLNLLGNAVKFTEEGGVCLRVKLGPIDNTTTGYFIGLTFEVEDSGPGIGLDSPNQIFEPFTQALNGYAKQEGTGLGLAICSQFVQQLGGKITVNSSTGKGTIFTFNICVNPAMASDLKATQGRRRVIGLKFDNGTHEKQTYRILVVDDHSENRALLRLLLEQVGFLVKEAENGKEALEIYNNWTPHLIWMDIRMPIMDGYETTKAIRTLQSENGADRPVIVALTASAFQEDRDAVLAAGCDDFVRRPFRETEIFSKMGTHLGVEFIYEPIKETLPEQSGPNDFNHEALVYELQILPKDTFMELKTALELSDMDQMNQVVNQLEVEHKVIAKPLRELVETFQYDRILKILDQIDNTKEGNFRRR